MDLHSLFRKFFHINPGYSRDPFFTPDDRRSEMNADAVFDDDFDSIDRHLKMFEQMENMFSSSFGIFDFPRFEEGLPPQATNPRNLMIKDNEDVGSPSSAKNFEDSMLSLLDESGKEFKKTRSFSYSKFSSIKTVHLPDGNVEEHRTVIDNDGNKTSTVRRTIGDTSHEITTKSDKQGIKEKEENFMNFDENELSSFDERWSKLKSNDTICPEVPTISVHDSNPSYLHYLKKLFGPFQKDEMKWI